jgi:hypothetical protein
VNAARGSAFAALLAVLTACRVADPAEHLVAEGRATRVVAVCFGGASPDMEAARRRFDTAGPMLRGRGYRRAELEAELARRGGILIDFTDRRFHSAYMSAHLWPHTDEPVTGYAILNVDRQVVFAESIWTRPNRPSSSFFYPWDTHEDQAPVCR